MCSLRRRAARCTRLLAGVRLVEAAGDVRVIVRLVNRDDAPRHVDDRTTQFRARHTSQLSKHARPIKKGGTGSNSPSGKTK